MAFHITHISGDEEIDPSLASLPALLAELQSPQGEHGSVSVTHETEWCLSVARGGAVTFEHMEEDSTQHLQDVSDEDILDLWRSLARGDIESVQAEPWQTGYPD